MLTFDDEEHIELADALGIAPVEKDGVAFATQAPRFLRAAWALRETAGWRAARVATALEATAMPGGSTESRLARIEEKLTELLRRTEPA